MKDRFNFGLPFLLAAGQALFPRAEATASVISLNDRGRRAAAGCSLGAYQRQVRNSIIPWKRKNEHSLNCT